MIGEEGKRDPRSGRYVEHTRCDCCGGTVKEHYTDDEVCGLSDDPGFYICGRVRCGKRTDGLNVEQRRELYGRQRAENRLANREQRKPKTVPLEAA